MKKLFNKRALISYAPLYFIVILGALLRFYNINWDQGNFFHPDERNIANSVSQISFFNQLNPHFFAYGGFFIYLVRFVGEFVFFVTKSHSWIFDWGYIDIIGRFIGAFFSTLTLIPLYFLTKKILGIKEALLAGIFYAFCVGSIQIAHFAITENLLAFFAVLICFLSIKIFEEKKLSSYLLTGFLLGTASATKTTALSFIVFPATAVLFLFLHLVKQKKKIMEQVFYVLCFLLITLFSFLCFSPYTILSWSKFIESMRYESGVALGTLPVPYTLQFTDTIPYLFQIKNFFWQIGPVTVFVILGLFVLIYNITKKKNPQFLIFISFPFVYFLYVGAWFTKFVRFMVPIIPFLIILAAYLLLRIRAWNKVVGHYLILISVFLTVGWALAYFSIYVTPQTRIVTSDWIYKNIPYGSKILGEHWDDGLPIPESSGRIPSLYQIEQLTIYNPDNGIKKEYYAQELSNADYIIINSRRLYGTLIHLTNKYPLTSKYYKLLFAEKLGYQKVAVFSSYPRIFGFVINDDASEETFQVYDHPKSFVFKNVKHLSKEDIMKILSG